MACSYRWLRRICTARGHRWQTQPFLGRKCTWIRIVRWTATCKETFWSVSVHTCHWFQKPRNWNDRLPLPKGTGAEPGHRGRETLRRELLRNGSHSCCFRRFLHDVYIYEKVLEPVSRTAEHADNSWFQVNTSSYHSPLNYIVITLKKKYLCPW